ncbi:MAG: hypothetical protein MJ181_03630 [Treponema sp.]|nr:hypothetical protein [Treponema sp.]
MKKTFLIFLLMISSLALFAQAGTSESFNNLIQNFFELRMNNSVFDSKKESEKILSRINEFEASTKSQVEKLTEEERLVVESYIVNEKFGVIYEDKSKRDSLKEMMKTHFDKMEKFCAGKENSDLSSWFLVSRGDVTSCYMVFSAKDVMKYGMAVKPMYETAIEKDPDFFLPYMNLSQWYYYAPGIAGGSKKKGVSLCKEAYELSKTVPEKYYTSIFYSQMLFENKQKDEAAKILLEAEKCFPESTMVKIIKEQNAKGKSLFEYNKEKSDLSKDVK